MAQPRACGQSSGCNECCGEIPVGSIAGVSFVVPGGYTPEFLNFCEVVFDQVPPLVHVGIVISLHLSVRFRRDDSDSTAFIKLLQEPVHVKGFIGQKRSKGNAADQRGDPFYVVRLSGQKQKAEQVSERINHTNNLGAQPATRAPDGPMA